MTYNDEFAILGLRHSKFSTKIPQLSKMLQFILQQEDYESLAPFFRE